MREVLPGIFHWTAVHPEIRVPVHCHYLEPQRMLLDPLVPAEGLNWSAYARLLSLDFDHLLFAHGEPWIGGGKQALAAFVAS